MNRIVRSLSNQTRALTLIAVLLGFSAPVQSQNVDVLFVYDTSGFASTVDHNALANLFITNANLALLQSGLPLLSYNFSVHPLPVNYTATPNTTSAELMVFMRDVDYNSGSIFDLRYQYGADVVVMIVDAFKGSTGQDGLGVQAGVPDSLINIWDFYRRGFVAISDHWIGAGVPGGNPSNGFAIVEGHEMGHVLFAQHDLLTRGSDSNPYDPVQHNHGHVVPKSGGVDGLQTIMATDQQSCGGDGDDCDWYAFYSDTDTQFPGTSITSGTSAWSRVQDLIPLTWPIVMAYRNPPPPTPEPPGCTVQFTGQCDATGQPQVLFTVSPAPGGVPVNSIDLEKKTGTGAWESIGQILDFFCLPFTTALNLPIQFKATMNTDYGISECSATIVIPSFGCDSGVPF